MGNITISLDKHAEERLRRIAAEEFHNKKGSLSKTIAMALDSLTEKTRHERAKNRQLRWMRQGFNMGKITIKSRADIYERR